MISVDAYMKTCGQKAYGWMGRDDNMEHSPFSPCTIVGSDALLYMTDDEDWELEAAKKRRGFTLRLCSLIVKQAINMER